MQKIVKCCNLYSDNLKVKLNKLKLSYQLRN